MLLQELILAALHHAGGHGLVLDPHIGQQGGGQAALQLHGPQAVHVQGGDGVIAPPQLLELGRREGPEGGQKTFCLGQEGRQTVRRQRVQVLTHPLGGGNNDPHSASSGRQPPCLFPFHYNMRGEKYKKNLQRKRRTGHISGQNRNTKKI